MYYFRKYHWLTGVSLEGAKLLHNIFRNLQSSRFLCDSTPYHRCKIYLSIRTVLINKFFLVAYSFSTESSSKWIIRKHFCECISILHTTLREYIWTRYYCTISYPIHYCKFHSKVIAIVDLKGSDKYTFPIQYLLLNALELFKWIVIK